MAPAYIAFHIIKSNAGLSAADLYFDIAFGTDIGPKPTAKDYDLVHRVLNDMLESPCLSDLAKRELSQHLEKLEERMNEKVKKPEPTPTISLSEFVSYYENHMSGKNNGK
jgi:hypothetical protein